jgi:hypothetical protein
MLNTLTEHDFQNAFKKMAEALGTVQPIGSDQWVQRVFDQMAAQVPEIMDDGLFMPASVSS